MTRIQQYSCLTSCKGLLKLRNLLLHRKKLQPFEGSRKEGWSTPDYYAICFLTLLIRGTINAVTVICCRQAGRRAGPDLTRTLLIYW